MGSTMVHSSWVPFQVGAVRDADVEPEDRDSDGYWLGCHCSVACHSGSMVSLDALTPPVFFCVAY